MIDETDIKTFQKQQGRKDISLPKAFVLGAVLIGLLALVAALTGCGSVSHAANAPARPVATQQGQMTKSPKASPSAVQTPSGAGSSNARAVAACDAVEVAGKQLSDPATVPQMNAYASVLFTEADKTGSDSALANALESTGADLKAVTLGTPPSDSVLHADFQRIETACKTAGVQ